MVGGRLEPFVPPESVPDWHDVQTVQLGELVSDGFDIWGDPLASELAWYSDEVAERVKRKVEAHYWFYEISMVPPGAWRKRLTALLLEELPKYDQLYRQLEAGASILADSDQYGKDRRVYSDFPATQLAPENQDYASTANDREWEIVSNGDWMGKARQVQSYRDVDAMIVDSLGGMFSCLVTVSLGSF